MNLYIYKRIFILLNWNVEKYSVIVDNLTYLSTINLVININSLKIVLNKLNKTILIHNKQKNITLAEFIYTVLYWTIILFSTKKSIYHYKK